MAIVEYFDGGVMGSPNDRDKYKTFNRYISETTPTGFNIEALTMKTSTPRKGSELHSPGLRIEIKIQELPIELKKALINFTVEYLSDYIFYTVSGTKNNARPSKTFKINLNNKKRAKSILESNLSDENKAHAILWCYGGNNAAFNGDNTFNFEKFNKALVKIKENIVKLTKLKEVIDEIDPQFGYRAEEILKKSKYFIYDYESLSLDFEVLLARIMVFNNHPYTKDVTSINLTSQKELLKYITYLYYLDHKFENNCNLIGNIFYKDLRNAYFNEDFSNSFKWLIEAYKVNLISHPYGILNELCKTADEDFEIFLKFLEVGGNNISVDTLTVLSLRKSNIHPTNYFNYYVKASEVERELISKRKYKELVKLKLGVEAYNKLLKDKSSQSNSSTILANGKNILDYYSNNEFIIEYLNNYEPTLDGLIALNKYFYSFSDMEVMETFYKLVAVGKYNFDMPLEWNLELYITINKNNILIESIHKCYLFLISIYEY